MYVAYDALPKYKMKETDKRAGEREREAPAQRNHLVKEMSGVVQMMIVMSVAMEME